MLPRFPPSARLNSKSDGSSFWILSSSFFLLSSFFFLLSSLFFLLYSSFFILYSFFFLPPENYLLTSLLTPGSRLLTTV